MAEIVAESLGLPSEYLSATELDKYRPLISGDKEGYNIFAHISKETEYRAKHVVPKGGKANPGLADLEEVCGEEVKEVPRNVGQGQIPSPHAFQTFLSWQKNSSMDEQLRQSQDNFEQSAQKRYFEKMRADHHLEELVGSIKSTLEQPK